MRRLTAAVTMATTIGLAAPSIATAEKIFVANACGRISPPKTRLFVISSPSALEHDMLTHD